MDDDDATWQLISSLIQLVLAAQRAGQHAGTVCGTAKVAKGNYPAT